MVKLSPLDGTQSTLSFTLFRFISASFPPISFLCLCSSLFLISFPITDSAISLRGDAEEIEDEQRERELINKRNAEFQNFVKKVEELVPGLEFDIPYAELGFMGVPHRNTVFLQPTVHCLINVIEFPFFVMPLDDVQIAYFERVSVPNSCLWKLISCLNLRILSLIFHLLPLCHFIRSLW